MAPRAYYLDETGDLVFLERAPGGTWSEQIARQARRERRVKA